MTDLFEQGRNLGKLEMKPLIRELIEALEEDYNRTAETMHLIDRAKEALDDPRIVAWIRRKGNRND